MSHHEVDKKNREAIKKAGGCWWCGGKDYYTVTAEGLLQGDKYKTVTLWELKDCYKMTSTRLLHCESWRTATRWQVQDYYTVKSWRTATRWQVQDYYTVKSWRTAKRWQLKVLLNESVSVCYCYCTMCLAASSALHEYFITANNFRS